MVTTGKKIYKHGNMGIDVIDIKYRTIDHIEYNKICKIQTVNNYIVGSNIFVLDGSIIYEIPKEISEIIHHDIISIIGDCIIMRTPQRFDATTIVIIYDFKKQSIIANCKCDSYCQLIESPNKKMVLIRKDSIYHIRCNKEAKICYVCDNYLTLTFGKSKFYYLLWKNNNEIVEFQSSYGHTKITTFDLNFKSKNVIIVAIHFIREQIFIDNDIIYLWNKEKIAVVDHSVRYIKNTKHVEIYNSYYAIFINDNLEQFKISGDRLIAYQHQYDFWYDDDKPKDIHYIMNLLMSLELFPNEIYNVIYQEQIKLKNKIIE